MRTLERFQKGVAPCPSAKLVQLAQWLEPAWSRYPELRGPTLEALALADN
jgi:hypothetical protein